MNKRNYLYESKSKNQKNISLLEELVGIEPTNEAFAVPYLTTWRQFHNKYGRFVIACVLTNSLPAGFGLSY